MSRTEFELILERASDAFWAEIVKGFPEVKSGDFGPMETHDWETACERAVKTWLMWNYPRPVIGNRYRLTRDVERYPHFTAKAGMVGTIMGDTFDERMIRLRMDDHIAGAEEWDNEICWTVEDDGPEHLSEARPFWADAELVIEPELRVRFLGAYEPEYAAFTVRHYASASVVAIQESGVIWVHLDKPVRDANQQPVYDVRFESAEAFLNAVQPMRHEPQKLELVVEGEFDSASAPVKGEEFLLTNDRFETPPGVRIVDVKEKRDA